MKHERCCVVIRNSVYIVMRVKPSCFDSMWLNCTVKIASFTTRIFFNYQGLQRSCASFLFNATVGLLSTAVQNLLLSFSLKPG